MRLRVLKMMKEVPVLAIFAIVLLGSAGAQLVGTPAPDWNNQQWLNSTPLYLSELKGRAVFLRFFTDPSCPFCRASAPFLNELHSRYQQKGLVVIGMYTPKPAPRETKMEEVGRFVNDYGFEFPVALDNDWATLKKYWLDRTPDADFTSVSFLIDARGIIRYVHPGGTYTNQDMSEIQKKLEAYL